MSHFKSRLLGVVLAMSMGSISSSCAASEGAAEPHSGFYYADSGEEYPVSTTGPTALSIKGPDGLCLIFWRSKEPQLIDGVETLRGQTCSNGTYEDLRWSVSVAEQRREVLVLIPPPEFFADGTIKPIEIKFGGDERQNRS